MGGALRRPESKVIEESFELAPKTVSGATTTNGQRKGVQIVGAATAKLREPKHVRTRGTNNTLYREQQSKKTLTVFIRHNMVENNN